MDYIPIINSTLLFNTAPIFIPLLTVFWLKIPVHRHVWYAVILGFISIIIIIRPGSDLFTDPGNLIALVSGITLAIAYLLMKQLTTTDPGKRIIFYYFFIGTLVQLPLLWFTKHLPSLENCLYSTLSRVTLLIAQSALVKAYLYADAPQVGIYQYSTVVFVGIIAWLLGGQAPPSLDIVGMVHCKLCRNHHHPLCSEMTH